MKKIYTVNVFYGMYEDQNEYALVAFDNMNDAFNLLGKLQKMEEKREKSGLVDESNYYEFYIEDIDIAESGDSIDKIKNSISERLGLGKFFDEFIKRESQPPKWKVKEKEEKEAKWKVKE